MKEKFSEYNFPNKEMCHGSGEATHSSMFIGLCIKALAEVIFDSVKEIAETLKRK